MPYWRMTKAQEGALREAIEGKTVIDIGCGDGALSVWCAQYAEHVTAIDKDGSRFPTAKFDNITFEQKYFDRGMGIADVLLLSWPPNSTRFSGIEVMARYFNYVVYLGKSTDGTACGPVEMWEHLIKRELISCTRDRANTLLVYGPGSAEGRDLDEEELAGVSNTGMFRFIEYGELRGKVSTMEELNEFMEKQNRDWLDPEIERAMRKAVEERKVG